MRLLLDTHALVWWFQGSSRLSAGARAAILAPDAILNVSAVSAWEIATKARAGKWQNVRPILARLPQLLADYGINPLPLTIAHGRLAGEFEADHRDPFDRMLAAQAQIEGMTLVTIDPAFAAFGVTTAW
jgi:PIN domain nuclease of toxin-antitoxin system